MNQTDLPSLTWWDFDRNILRYSIEAPVYTQSGFAPQHFSKTVGGFAFVAVPI